MKRLTFVLLLCIVISASLSTVLFLVATAFGETIVTAAQVNGTWRAKNAELKVLALGKQRLKLEFYGTYEYKTSKGPMANIGSGSGVALIKGDTAIFKPDDADDDCRITMKFTEGKLIVRQEGTCGFGLNVTADGTYRKVDNRKPKFDE